MLTSAVHDATLPLIAIKHVRITTPPGDPPEPAI